MRSSAAIAGARFSGCAAMVLGIVLLFRWVAEVNPTTVALSYLLLVLGVSAVWRLRYAVFTSLIATLCFNFFFLPPYGTLTIADPQNWIALFAFLMVGVVGSHLAERAHRSADIANQRRREAERLYAFSQKLLLTEKVVELLNAVPAYILEVFGVHAALLVNGRQQIYRSGPDVAGLDAGQLKAVTARGEPVTDSEGRSFMPVMIGVQVKGSIGIAGGTLSRETLEAISSLIAIAIERAGAVEKLTRMEAAQASEKLRSALLDSVTHELRTPLTSIKASVTGLLSDANLSEASRQELLTVINEEADRLNRLVGEATEMALLDASQVELHLETQPIGPAIEAAIEACKQTLKDRRVEVHLQPGLPSVRMDPARIKEVLTQLLENAAKYSPPGSPISITAEVKNSDLVTSVADRGQGIDDFEQALIFDKFYRGQNQRGHSQGTGMGLAIAKAIVEAHDGTIGTTSQPGHGSVFYFTLPIAE